MSSNHRNKVNLLAFLEIFSKEGGIQSYVKDIFRGYQSLASSKQVPPADILLLRDDRSSINPFESEKLKFSYLKTKPVWLGRLRMAATLLLLLLWRRPQQVFCGHIN
ncbi:MAG: glycosyl transferase group 1, partial [Okeania sp. SIO2H7]|nr:glycosyl transferase group 1 [Okeania sp. SIO2H7]